MAKWKTPSNRGAMQPFKGPSRLPCWSQHPPPRPHRLHSRGTGGQQAGCRSRQLDGKWGSAQRAARTNCRVHSSKDHASSGLSTREAAAHSPGSTSSVATRCSCTRAGACSLRPLNYAGCPLCAARALVMCRPPAPATRRHAPLRLTSVVLVVCCDAELHCSLREPTTGKVQDALELLPGGRGVGSGVRGGAATDCPIGQLGPGLEGERAIRREQQAWRVAGEEGSDAMGTAHARCTGAPGGT